MKEKEGYYRIPERCPIARQAKILLGHAPLGSHGSKASKMDILCEEMFESAREEALYSVYWPFALKKIENKRGSAFNFVEAEGVDDCGRVAIISPSRLEFYCVEGKIYFKGGDLDICFYYPIDINQHVKFKGVPTNFISLSALCLASNVSFALYSDSVFTEGLRNQYLRKQKDLQESCGMKFEIRNSARI